MTISVAWMRDIGKGQELAFASDSRLRAGYEWDTGQKVFPIPGLNAVISFAGHADLAFPVIHHIISSCESYKALRDGSADIAVALDHILMILNDMRSQFKNAVAEAVNDMNNSTFLIFGGYSYISKRLSLWRLAYDVRLKQFTARKPGNWGGGRNRSMLLCFAGDYYEEYRQRLVALLFNAPRVTRFNYEPLQVLTDMLLANRYPTIGGAPQIVKVYEHRNYLPYAVYWKTGREKTTKIYYFGRRFMRHEKTTYPIIDPRTLKVTYPLKTITN